MRRRFCPMRNIIFYFTLCFLGLHTMAQQNNLERKILDIVQSVDGTIAVAFRDMDNPGNKVLINEHETFHAASTMKTPVMIELFRQAAEGVFSLDDSLVVKNEFTSIADGSTYSISIDRDGGEALYKYLGEKVSIRQLIKSMITASGNLATNILIELAGPENVTKSMHEMGANNLSVLRGVEDMKAFERGLNNTLTANDLLVIYEHLARGTAVSQSASGDMISILTDQQHGDLIPEPLPDDVMVAHKTGSISGVRHDSGIVFLPNDRSYVVVILSKELSNESSGEAVIREISRMIYDEVSK